MPHDLTTKEIDWFWSQVEVTDDCWYWTGAIAHGYGAFMLRRRRYFAHRLAYELAYGAIPDGLVIRHRCDHPPCVRPDHLEPGTIAQNNADKATRPQPSKSMLRDLIARIRRPKPTPDELFWSKVDRSGDCWIWTGTRMHQGYGVVIRNYKRLYAHRVAFEIAYGPIPDGMDILHRCDNPPCVRPEHLDIGTHTDNMRDASRKGRLATGDRSGQRTHPERTARGDRHGSKTQPGSSARGESNHSKLTEADVIELRRLRAEVGMSFPALGRRFGVSGKTAEAIVKRKKWKHID
jgi:hypothetical protein